jgi:hypothetical protein
MKYALPPDPLPPEVLTRWYGPVCPNCQGTGFTITGAVWVPSAWLCAQLSHTGWGAFLVLAVAPHLGLAWTWAMLLVFVLLKDGIFDMVVEGSTWTGEAVDGLFYCLGGLIGCVALWSLP